MASHEDRRVDELRQQLRALGYLDARIDRFVLAGGSSGARPAGFAIAASARIGLLAGVLLGPAAVIGLQTRSPGLVTGPADAVVLAAYLAAVFGIGASLLASLAIVAGGWIARRAAARPGFSRHASRAAAASGLLVGIGSLGYLVLWWRAAATTSLPVVTTSAMLVVAVAISLTLGHVVTVTILALLARLGLGSALAPGLPLSSRRSVGMLGVTALAGSALLLVATRAPGEATPTPALTVVPTGERVVVLAIDGIDAETVARMNTAGRLPRLGPALGRNVVSLPSDTNRDPARVWTTIATGQPPERHGIRGLESRSVAGLEGRFRPASPLWSALTAATDVVRLTRPALASGEERLIPSFWEVAARAGLRTAVVHWWATWPAPEGFGIVLSDRAILRLEQGGDADAEIAPASLYEALGRDWETRRARARAVAAAAQPDAAAGDIADVIARSAELDATLIDLASDPVLGPLDLLVLYLPGLDIAQHALLGSNEAGAMAQSETVRRLASLERYYEFLDGALDALVRPAQDPTLLIVIGQPGRVRAPDNGFMALDGSLADRATGRAEVTAVAPTVLYALGLPMASDLPSAPVLDLFDDQFVASHQPRLVATYGTRHSPSRASAGRPLDREMIERMRSLGYLR